MKRLILITQSGCDMDSSVVSTLIGGFITLLSTLGGCIAFLHNVNEKTRKEAEVFRAEALLRMKDMEALLKSEYLRIDPHMIKHETINKRIKDSEDRIIKIENEIKALRERDRR